MESSPPAVSAPPTPSVWNRIAGHWSLDRLGMWVSGACAVHCATLPLLITIAGFGWLGDERLEWTIIGFSFLVASLRLSHSYLREHRHTTPLLLFALGALAILFAKSEITAWEPAEIVGMTIGGSMIALAHWRNHRCNRCATHLH
jgi:hypothetical protein